MMKNNNFDYISGNVLLFNQVAISIKEHPFLLKRNDPTSSPWILI